jgi:DNA repair exonuclease SbcCD ATPase subunit
MRISLLRVSNFKRVRQIEITPEADRAVILIAGKNAQGKSSLLDAITVAVGGKRMAPADPVRHGAEESVIDLELDGGDLAIHRVIDVSGESKLEVREKGNLVRSPQARLDKLVGSRFLDPLAFLSLTASEQRAQLLAMFDRDGAIAKLEERRERIYAKRTEVGRDLKKAAGELARVKEVEVGQVIDVAALAAERDALSEKQRMANGLGSESREVTYKLRNAEEQLAKCDKSIADLERQLAAAREARAGWAKNVESLATAAVAIEDKAQAAEKELDALKPRRDQIDADLKRAHEHNRAVFEAEANNKRRAAAADTVKQLEAQTSQQTELLDKIEAQKLDVLASVGLPVQNLGISAEGLTLSDVPFAQASAAERLRVALALAMAASPGLDDVWIRDGALLDDDSLQLLAEEADKAGKRCWVERVGDRDPGAIIIHDGTERQESERAAS